MLIVEKLKDLSSWFVGSRTKAVIERPVIVVRETRTAAQFYKRFTFVLHLFTTKKLPGI